MSANGNGLVQKLRNYCNVLRDDGLSYQDYLEHLTYLLFLKMADEQTRPPFDGRPVWDHVAGTVSAPFAAGDHRRVAVKAIDDRGNELLVVKSRDDAE